MMGKRCEKCKWAFQCPPEQDYRTACRACEASPPKQPPHPYARVRPSSLAGADALLDALKAAAVAPTDPER